ncbi:predicted protein [Histoplasma mississippiense (nom. inval.)]|uniref:predicted protein n=1 Tax=Ajellomyces capsulatus (strain NAm1 / WU24) TaxID=2059318 RepID=UPI000157C603|nr:predicted protein [Histoplasma mississippiense (nom. inval.)]EDN08787.1 predicted protein [Histoplasma mississippiense (nom. inval.)]
MRLEGEGKPGGDAEEEEMKGQAESAAWAVVLAAYLQSTLWTAPGATLLLGIYTDIMIDIQFERCRSKYFFSSSERFNSGEYGGQGMISIFISSRTSLTIKEYIIF